MYTARHASFINAYPCAIICFIIHTLLIRLNDPFLISGSMPRDHPVKTTCDTDRRKALVKTILLKKFLFTVIGRTVPTLWKSSSATY